LVSPDDEQIGLETCREFEKIDILKGIEASSWLFIRNFCRMHGQQNIKLKKNNIPFKPRLIITFNTWMEEATHKLIHILRRFLSSSCPYRDRTCFLRSRAIPDLLELNCRISDFRSHIIIKNDILSHEYLQLLPVGLIVPQKELTQWPTHSRVIRDSLLLRP
jgi:hypothetical protein